MTKISAKCFNSMIQESDDEPLEEQWEDQRQAEWEKECANRAALIESLMNRLDWVACQNWLKQWQKEDEASADEVDNPSADLLSKSKLSR
jgi:hypothetical protein